ncbi:MAG: MerR family transcriptional regulator [Chloroflexota bacterium]
MANRYTIQQAAEITGISAHTLRYYERIGLLHITRAKNGHRRYTEDDLGWVSFILLLRNTDMPLPDIAEYMQLEKEGMDTIDERRRMLRGHREILIARIAQLQDHLSALDAKISHYSQDDSQPLNQTQVAEDIE